MRDVHPTNIDHTAVARPRTLAHDRLNAEDETKDVMTDATTTGVLPANTIPVAAVFHVPQTRAADGSHILVHDAQTRAHRLANIGKEMADAVRLLLSIQRQSVHRLLLDVVHHQAMSLIATAVPDLQETTGMNVHQGRTEMTIVP